MWKLNSDWKFIISSARNMIRDQRAYTNLNNMTWHNQISFKCSLLIWRSLRGKLPTNEKLISFGHDPHECYYCYWLGMDTIEHVFMIGHFATNI